MNEILSLLFWASAPLMPAPSLPGADTVRVTVADVSVPDTSATAAGAPQSLPMLSLTSAVPSLRADARPEGDQQKRTRAIEYSDWYARRLTIHKIGGIVSLPLFAAEYWVGNKLMNDLTLASWVRPMHGTLASAIGIVFGLNTLTGAWNLYDSRNDPHDRARKIVHTVGMLAADAGFLYTASLAGDDRDEGGYSVYNGSKTQQHKNAALVSIGISGVSTVMMWLWKH